MCVFLYCGKMCVFVNVCLVMSVLQNEYTKKGAMPFSACPFLKVFVCYDYSSASGSNVPIEPPC